MAPESNLIVRRNNPRYNLVNRLSTQSVFDETVGGLGGAPADRLEPGRGSRFREPGPRRGDDGGGCGPREGRGPPGDGPRPWGERGPRGCLSYELAAPPARRPGASQRPAAESR